MWASLVLLLLLIVLFGILLVAFIPLFIVLMLNGLVLYLIGLRMHADIQKRRDAFYLTAFIISALMLLTWGNLFPIWWVTALVLQAFVIAHLLWYLKKTYLEEKAKHKKVRKKKLAKFTF